MVIDARDLRLQAGDRVLFDRLTFQVFEGECVAVLGPNGAGKTTLLRTIAGLRRAAGGRVCINEADILALSAGERARRLSYVASDEVFEDRLTVRDVVATGRFAHHRWWEWTEESADTAAVNAALAAAGLASAAGRRFTTLSSGERQRAWLALALAQEAPLMLLDEPTSHLDVGAAQEILSLLRRQLRIGKTILCVLHDLNEAAAYADRILLLGHGRMLAVGAPRDVLSSELLRDAYGVAMECVRTAAGVTRVFPSAAAL